MPRRKKLPKTPNFIGGGRNPNELMVQKTNPLLSLSETSITLPELKILDAYLSRINSHNDEARYVRFEKGELERLLGVVKISKDDLSKRLDNLFVAVTLRDERKPKGFTKIGLFEKADCEIDDNGLWQVDLACTTSAMEYFFNPEHIGYFKYRLHNVVNLTSRYSYVLYLYLEKKKSFKSWNVSLDELKQILNCNSETYNAYYRFNDLVLKKCYKELMEKTDIRFNYEALNAKKQPLKPRQKAVYICFTLDTKSNTENRLAFEDIPEPSPQSDLVQLISSACHNEFTDIEIEELLQHILVKDVPPHRYGIDIARYHYTAQMYAKLCRQAEKNKIPNRLSYLIKMIDND